MMIDEFKAEIRKIDWQDKEHLLKEIDKLKVYVNSDRLTILEQIWVEGYLEWYREQAQNYLKIDNLEH